MSVLQWRSVMITFDKFLHGSEVILTGDHCISISPQDNNFMMIQRLLRSFSSQDYHRIKADGTDLVINLDEKSERSDKSTESRPVGQCSRYWVCLWVCALIFVVLLSTYLIFAQISAGFSAYPTDLYDAQPNVIYEKRVFTGRLNYNESSGLLYREVDPSSVQYFGEPSPEIDAAWDELLRGIN